MTSVFFIFKRATTRELFRVHICGTTGRCVYIPGDVQDTGYKLWATSPGFDSYRDNGGAGISDSGIRSWMIGYNVPADQWPAGV